MLRDLLAPLTAPALLIVLAACRGEEAGTPDSRPATRDSVRVAVLFDVGGRGDGGFNDGAAAGAERARAAGGVQLEYDEVGDTGNRAAAVRALAATRPDAIVAIGFLASHDVTVVAREFPDVHFTVVDYAVPLDSLGRAMEPPANLAGITFREHEGAYLVGAIAALSSRTGTVGFVGGMDSPVIRKFEAGFTAGAHRACKECTVDSRYVGTTPDAFDDPAGGQRAAQALIGGGADVVFHAAGASGAGVFRAVRDAGRHAVGVDVDQWSAAPGRVLTSMVKRIDVAVHDAIVREQRGSFRPGVASMGLAEGAIDYVLDERNTPLLAPATRARAETLRAALVAGLLTAPAAR